MDKNKPIQTFRLGYIEAAIWANQGQKGVWYTATLSRSYKEKNGKWQRTDRFSLSDIPLATKVLEHAYAYLYDLQSQLPDGEEPGDVIGDGSMLADGNDKTRGK